jgi:hypothetical protein
MRLRSFLFILLLTCFLGASPWGDFVQRRRGADPRAGRWILCVRQGDFPAVEAYLDPAFRKLLTGGDCALEQLGAAVAQDLWAQRGWGREAHWVLLAPHGQEAASGSGRPRGEEVLDAIHAGGAMPRWEAREQFLRAHPDQGEACLEAVNQAFQELRVRLTGLDRAGKVRVPAWHSDPRARPGFTESRISLGPGSQGEEQADELYAGVAEAFERLIGLPGWERQAAAVADHLGTFEVGQSGRMRQLCRRAAADLENALREDPYDPDLANFWMEATDAAGLPLEVTGVCTPVPGEPWPDPAILGRLVEPCYRRRDWDRLLKLLSDLTPQGQPEPMTEQGWSDHCGLLGAIGAHRAIALARMGSWDLAGAALAEGRHWGGSGGVREVLLTRSLVSEGGDLQAWRNLLAQALGRDGAPPMPAPIPPLRLVAGGTPPWIGAWSALRLAPELAPWSPAELRWEVEDREAHARSAARNNWAPGPRWALCRGQELRASGAACPDPRALAALLEGEGLTVLQRLQGVLAAQPNHEAARLKRHDLVMRRMPDRRLEATLAEDAARTHAVLEFGPDAEWKPDPGLWSGAASQVLPGLEQLIRTWPNRTHLWRAWITWARFHPARPSVLGLIQSTAFWSPRGEWRAWLPYEVQRAVAAELKRQGSFNAMRDWFQPVWDSLDQRPLRAIYPGEQKWVLERRREEETAVFQPLRDALAALDCTREQAELERAFGEMIGRQPNRRR